MLRAFALSSGRPREPYISKKMLVQILPLADKKGCLSCSCLSLYPTSGSNTFSIEKMWKLGAAIFSIFILQTFANEIETREEESESRRENKRKFHFALGRVEFK